MGRVGPTTPDHPAAADVADPVRAGPEHRDRILAVRIPPLP